MELDAAVSRRFAVQTRRARVSAPCRYVETWRWGLDRNSKHWLLPPPSTAADTGLRRLRDSTFPLRNARQRALCAALEFSKTGVWTPPTGAVPLKVTTTGCKWIPATSEKVLERSEELERCWDRKNFSLASTSKSPIHPYLNSLLSSTLSPILLGVTTLRLIASFCETIEKTSYDVDAWPRRREWDDLRAKLLGLRVFGNCRLYSTRLSFNSTLSPSDSAFGLIRLSLGLSFFINFHVDGFSYYISLYHFDLEYTGKWIHSFEYLEP
ncbi:hypothetical protein R3P38DRAFT_2769993 [Favolaschia claudopus]|uniref:Uncharacterized protein n=1 Tax=Favolaschia claudopus TaxID=2862362 RepID=A0AAW0CP29_9AGAR